MSGTQLIIQELNRNHSVIQAQIKGLSNEDSLLQLPFRGNCLNWVLGHIVDSRSSMHRLAGIDVPWGADDYAAYRRNSEPITDAEHALSLERIVADLERSQKVLLPRLEGISEAELNATFDDERTVDERLNFLSWHETYHTGQTEYLRQLAGANDKVI